MIKPIPEFDGYFISDDGKVYSNLGKGNRRNNKTVPLYEIKPRLTKHGYCRVYMRHTLTGKRMDRYIHRLVAEAFIPNPLNKKYVNHINFCRSCNKVENLEWVTAKENTSITEKMAHVIRDATGRFQSNYVYVIR